MLPEKLSNCSNIGRLLTSVPMAPVAVVRSLDTSMVQLLKSPPCGSASRHSSYELSTVRHTGA